MKQQVGVEDIERDHWVAWVFDLMGCYTSARTKQEAIALLPTGIATHYSWLEQHGFEFDHTREDIEFDIVESFKSYELEDGYRVNAFFEDDERRLSNPEVQNAQEILAITRDELLGLVRGCTQDELNRENDQAAGGSIAKTIEHIAWAEWWYLDRLDLAFERERMPADPLEMVAQVRSDFLDKLLIFPNVDRITTLNQERWSVRKVLRRAVWHERDHTQQIRALLRDHQSRE